MDGGRQTADGTRRTDIWITKSLPELSSGETTKLGWSLREHNIFWRSIFDPPYRLTRPDFVHHFSPRKPVL